MYLNRTLWNSITVRVANSSISNLTFSLHKYLFNKHLYFLAHRLLFSLVKDRK